MNTREFNKISKTTDSLYKWIPRERKPNLIARKELHSYLVDDTGAAERFLAMCFVDPRIWFATTLWTFNPQAKPGYRDIPFIPWPHQDPAILSIKNAIDSGTEDNPTDLFFLKSRKQGATYIILGTYLLYFLASAGSKFLLGSRVENLVDNGCEVRDGCLIGSEEALFYKLLYMLNTIPEYLRPSWKALPKKHLFLQNLDNDAAFRGDTTNIGFGKAFRATSAMVDEAAAIEAGPCEWIIENLSDTSQCNIFNSTKGPLGDAHPYDKLMAANPERTLKLSFYDNPTQNYGLYESPADGKIIIRDIDYFRKTYGGEFNSIEAGEEIDVERVSESYPFIADAGVSNFGMPRTVWLDQDDKRPGRSSRGKAQNLLCLGSGSTQTFFDFSLISKLRSKQRPPDYYGDIKYEVNDMSITDEKFIYGGTNSLIRWWGELKWGRPLQSHNYAVGCDLSRGTGASNSVAAVKDVNTNELVGMLVTAYTKRPQFAEMVIALCQWVGGAESPVLNWEENGADEFTDRIMELGYWNLYKRKGKPTGKQKWANQYGWKSTPGINGTKIAMLNELDGSLREGLLEKPQYRHLKIYDEQTINELEAYVFFDGRIDVGPVSSQTETSGAKAAHGDRPIGVGLADMAGEQQIKGRSDYYRNAQPGSFAERMKIKTKMDADRKAEEKQWVC